MTAPGHYHFTWRVFPHLDLMQMSGLLTGVMALVRDGLVTLSFEPMDSVPDLPYSALEFTLRKPGSGESRRVVWEFYDRSDRLADSGLGFAEVYFKRQMAPATRALPQAAGVRPLGLTVPGFSLGAFRLVAAALRRTLSSREIRRHRSGPALVRECLSQLVDWARAPHPDSALRRSTDSKEARIVFQPRLWAQSGDRPEPAYEEANADRIRLVGELRSAFPGEDRIGLVHGAAADQLAPSLRLARRVSMEEHRRQLRGSTIAVNCTGLSGSVGWKFAEYLAAGTAVVSPPIETILPEPIQPEVHYLPYTTAEECVAQCRRLMDEPGLAARMGETNRSYYLRWVHPPAHVRSLFQRAFDPETA